MFCSIQSKPMCLKNFTLINILDYAESFSSATGNDSVVARVKSGLSLFNEKFVSNVQFTGPDTFDVDGAFEVQAKVHAEMKKMVRYEPKVNITTDCKVTVARCTCAAGSKPAFCKHVFAVLDYSQKELYAAPTERLQIWCQPKPTKSVPLDSESMFSEGEPEKIQLSTSSFNGEGLDDYCIPVLDVCFESLEAKYSTTVGLPAVVCSNNCFHCLPDSLSVEVILFVHKHYSKNKTELVDIEHEAMWQNCPQWQYHRKMRLTASSVKDIVTRKADFEQLAMNILNLKDKDLSHILAIAYGLENEDPVRNWWIKQNPQCVVRNTGVVIHPFHQYIAASPDGLIRSGDDYMLLEIKCIFNAEHLTRPELCEKGAGFGLTDTGSGFTPKKHHKYYYQIQCQLAVANLKTCVLVVYYNSKGEKMKST